MPEKKGVTLQTADRKRNKINALVIRHRSNCATRVSDHFNYHLVETNPDDCSCRRARVKKNVSAENCPARLAGSFRPNNRRVPPLNWRVSVYCTRFRQNRTINGCFRWELLRARFGLRNLSGDCCSRPHTLPTEIDFPTGNSFPESINPEGKTSSLPARRIDLPKLQQFSKADKQS
jgi:hypothetical protein